MIIEVYWYNLFPVSPLKCPSRFVQRRRLQKILWENRVVSNLDSLVLVTLVVSAPFYLNAVDYSCINTFEMSQPCSRFSKIIILISVLQTPFRRSLANHTLFRISDHQVLSLLSLETFLDLDYNCQSENFTRNVAAISFENVDRTGADI